MRATILIAAVVLLAGLAPAWAETSSSPSPADLAFFKSLAGPQALPPDTPDTQEQELPPTVGTPGPQLKACTVTQDCQDGTSVMCNGNSTCQTTIAGVKCDGTETRCPNYCSIAMSCQCCNGPYTSFCWSRRGDCQYTSNGISCNGNEFTCEMGCPLCPEW